MLGAVFVHLAPKRVPVTKKILHRIIVMPRQLRLLALAVIALVILG